MKIFYTFLSLLCTTLLLNTAQAQEAWPKTVSTANGTVLKLYQWQPESFSGNTLQARAAISVIQSGKTDPVFGVVWLTANTLTDNNEVQVQSAAVTNMKLPTDISDDDLNELKGLVQNQVPGWSLTFPLKDLQQSLEVNQQQNQLAKDINNTPPKVIYSTAPSILVLIDGTPRLQKNNEWGVETVVNTPFTLVKNNDGKFYLYGGKHWYTAPVATGPYSLTTSVPVGFDKISTAVNEASKGETSGDDGKETDANTIYKIIVSTEPAELIQSNGEAKFAAVESTGLLYVSNSDDDIFMDVNSQQYYVLLSGRWYTSKTLNGNWQYTSPDRLPADFAKIPEGSSKDNVLASVAGTEAANDAVLQAEVPQTAKVDRNNAKADITYDGDPQFEDIEGTDLDYAINTPSSVIRWRGRYYSVDNGVWFESYSANGPWQVCVERPYAVALIPPRYPVYNMKYVYIYDVTPDYVYMGYTPGYLNTFICGPTVVYGTGYYYRPWYRNYYYPRPYTWGFNVHYNPWYGWGLGINFSTGWFHIGIGSGYPRGYSGGGWWGPRAYRPYCYDPYRYRTNYGYAGRGGYYGNGGYYGGRYGANRNVTIINNYNHNNNIYRNRRDVVSTYDNRWYVPVRGGINNGGRQGWSSNNYPSRNRPDGSNYNNNNRPGGDNGRNGSPYNTPGRRYNVNDNNGRAGGSNNGYNRPGTGSYGRQPATSPNPGNNGNNNGGRRYQPFNNNNGQPQAQPTQPGGGRTATPGQGSTRPMVNREWRNNYDNGRNDRGAQQPRVITQPPTREPVRRDFGGGDRSMRPTPQQPQMREPVQRSPQFERPSGGGGRPERSSGGGSISRPAPSSGGDGNRSGGGEHRGGRRG